jgi:hypothetical protein
MKQLHFIMLLFITGTAANAQGYYFNLGQNFTTYDYKNSSGQRNSNIKSDNGLMVDFGYQWIVSNDRKWQYKAGLSYQQFNAIGRNVAFAYSWNSNYLGIQNSISYEIYTTYGKEVTVKINSGFTGTTIINGEQTIDNTSYDLTRQEEYKGLFLQPHIGLENDYYINESIRLGIGYRFSKAIRIGSNAPESLNFTNNTFYLNFKYTI